MTGILTLSIEIELGWGTHDRGEYDYFSPSAVTETETLGTLLDLCDRYEIPITFDIVGHLLEETCGGTHDGPYPDGWWAEDPGTSEADHPLFYAPSFAKRIDEAATEHELGTHTYSHVLCDEVSVETIRHELKQARQAHEEAGLEPPRSIVFPRHQTPPYNVFSDLGIEVVRHPIRDYNVPENSVRKFLWGATRRHLTAELRREHGLVETRCTPHPSLSNGFLRTGQAALHPLLRVMPLSVRQRISRRYIYSGVDRAANQDGHAHLWTHLFNMSNEEQLPPIEAGLEYMAQRRNEGQIRIERMCDLPEVAEGG